MFDSLLGRKFTTKCKHAIKCIYERLKPIRNRRQAVVNILRKDIADLIRSGNVEHAFARMDEVIIEMNRLACYDIIEKFCESVLVQLPLLQKQRECPPEDIEAICTLIFAAARFPDLPELCDLRQEFTMRYGSAEETSVNPEFKDKSASKAFSVSRKLHLMKNIACEFSVKWDSESFEYRITNPVASKRDQTKKRDELKASKSLPVDEKDRMVKQVVAKTDIHVISHEPEPMRKNKPWTADPENMMSLPIDSSNPRAKPEKDKHANFTEDGQRRSDTHGMSLRAREVLDPINQDGTVVERLKSKDDYTDRSKVRPDMFKPNGTNAEYQGDVATIYKRSSRARVMLNSNGEEDDVVEKLKSKDESKARRIPSFVQQESDSIGDCRGRSKAPPDAWELNGIDAKYSGADAVVFKRSSRDRVMSNPNGEDGGVMDKSKSKHESRVRHAVPPVPEDNRIAAEGSDDIVHRSSRATVECKAEQKQAVGQQEFEEIDNPKRVPQYMKPKDMNSVIHSEGWDKDGAIHEQSGKARQRADLAGLEGKVVGPEKPHNDRAFHMLPPPYFKSAVRKVGADDEHARPSRQSTREGPFATSNKSASPPTNEGFATSVKSNNGGYKELTTDELVADDERPKPRSVRRKQQKPSVIEEVDNIPHGDDDPSPPIPHGHRRRSSRQNTISPQDNYDKEEMVMDKLLMHYSEKGISDQAIKHRTGTRALRADHTLHDGDAGQHETNGSYRSHRVETVQASRPDHTISISDVREQQSYGKRSIPKAESAQAFPSDRVVQDGEALRRQAYSKSRVHRPEPLHPPDRIVSLPPDPVTPKERTKVPARATSMQPDSPSTLGGRTHPELPDYDELAARFAALKRG